MGLTKVELKGLDDGTDGQIITYDASGNPVAVGPGTDGQVLTSTGAGSPPAFEDIPAKAALTGSTNNTVCTVTGANAIQGEANLTYDGTTLKNTVAAENGTIAQFELSGQTNNPALLIKADESDQQITFRAGSSTSTYPSIAFDMGTVGDSVVIQNNGNLTISDGNLVVAGGHGIDFSAQTATSETGATTTSELLDHYEEGTFSPTYGGSSSNPTCSYDNQVGQYVKIGRIVTAFVRLRTDSVSGGSGTLYVRGLPFSSSSYHGMYGAYVTYTGGWSADNAPSMAHIGAGNLHATLYNREDGNEDPTVMNVNHLSNTNDDNDLRMTLIYAAPA